MAKIGVAIVGAGEMGVERATLCRVLPQYELVCLVDKSFIKAQVASRLLGVPAYTSLRMAMKKQDFQAVLICAPEPVHKELALEALEGRKHVLMEKPLTTNWEDSKFLVQKAREAGVVHMVDYNVRHFPTFRKLKEFLDQGGLGALHYVQAVGHESLVLGSGENELEGYLNERFGLFGVFGVHNLDLLCWYMGRPLQVWAQARQVHSPRTRDLVLALCQFESGALGVIDLGWSHWGIEKGSNRRFMITGDNGTAWVDDDSLALFLKEPIGELKAGHNKFYAPEIAIPESFGVTSKRLSFGMEEFAAAIAEGRPASPSWEEGLMVDTLVEAILRGSGNGLPISIAWKEEVTLSESPASVTPVSSRGLLDKLWKRWLT